MQWTPDYITKHVARRVKVSTQHKNPVFMYYDKQQPMANLEQINWTTPSQKVFMTLDEFFHKAGANASSATDYVYFSGSFEDFHEIRSDLEPIDWLTVDIGSSTPPIRMVG